MDQLLGLSEPWAYLFIGALAAAEASAFVGLFLPGEAAMLLGGVLAYQGRVGLGLMVIAGCTGAVVGDSIGYEIGRRLGPRLRSGRLGRRIGEERWDRAAVYLRERGGRAIFFGRFVGVLRALVPAVAGSAGMPYRAFLPANVAGGAAWASAFIVLGYVFGGSWKAVERWAGRASLVLLILFGLAVSIAIGTRWVRDHADDLFARWRTFIEHPRVADLRGRYRRQIDFLVRRIDRRSVMGLRLTVSLLLVVTTAWAFGSLLEDVVARNESALVDGPVFSFMSSHRAPAITGIMRLFFRVGEPLVAFVGSVLLFLIAWFHMSSRSVAGLIALTTAGLGLPYLVQALISRVGPPDALVPQTVSTFPSVRVTTSTLLVLGIATVVAHGRRWGIRVWTFGAAAFVASSVALASVYLAAAWLTDAMAGLVLALSWFAVSHSVTIPASVRLTRRREIRD